MNYLRIKELMKEKGVTSREMAKVLGISENGMSMIINGKRQPRFEILERISNHLELEVWQLFRGSEHAIRGYVEVSDRIHRITTEQDLEQILKLTRKPLSN